MSESTNVNNLFASAADDGDISPETAQLLQVSDIGQQIQGALGVDADTFEASDVVLVSVMPDDSGSIRFAGKAQEVRDGHNLVVDALSDSKQSDNILMHTRYLNGEILFPYSPLSGAVRMDSHNYNPNQGTPLNDESVSFLCGVLAKTKEFSDQGIPARSVSCIISDGADMHSHRNSAADVAKVVRDMLALEDHIVCAIGIDSEDAVGVNFKEIFMEMGIPEEWILEVSATKPDGTKKSEAEFQSDIRKAFAVFSQSAVRASQGAASFSQTALGGFGSN